MKQFLGALVLGLAVVGSAQAARVYPNVLRDAFIHGCTKDGDASHRTCACVIDRIAARYSIDQFFAIAQRSEARGEKVPVEILHVALPCLVADTDTAF
jgi:hypothetical protein